MGEDVILNYYKNHIKTWKDLVTTYEATRKGFVSIMNLSFKYLHSTSNKWIDGNTIDQSIEENSKGLYWEKNNGDFRTLIFNLTPPIVSKNVDICIFECKFNEYGKSITTNPKKYIALGELKGGIDPAGADEHWKTANTALNRIRTSFKKLKISPHTFFIGAAIEDSMANEIFSQLKKNILSNAANLTDEFQLNSICHWICNL